MIRDYNFYVYIMASFKGTLYIGVTNDLERRVSEHQAEIYEGFSKQYKCKKLIYYEYFTDIRDAIDREKQIKKWGRAKKEILIDSMNSNWEDLSKDF